MCWNACVALFALLMSVLLLFEPSVPSEAIGMDWGELWEEGRVWSCCMLHALIVIPLTGIHSQGGSKKERS